MSLRRFLPYSLLLLDFFVYQLPHSFHHLFSVEEVVKVVVLCHVIARVISLNVLNKGLEVEVGELVHD